MPGGGTGALANGAGAPWPLRPGPVPPGSPSRYVYLLDLDDDLAQDIEFRMRFSARQHATARVLAADYGECDLSACFGTVGEGPGLLILDGLMSVETRVADRTVTELFGSGDLLQPPGAELDETIERAASWRALTSSRLALLDSEFAARVRAWPQILHGLLRRTERRGAELDTLRAISCQPKLEARLILLLWHLAARWGRVEPTGLRLSLPLTHRLLGQLVAAERPSISHALTRLSQAGIVTGHAGDWHLHGTAHEHIESLIERTPRLAAPAETAAQRRQRGALT